MDQRQQQHLAKLAGGFAKTTGLDYDDLHQEAQLAYWQASHDPRYDPRKAALTTFCSFCTYTHLCSYAAKQRTLAERLPTEPLDLTMPDDCLSQDDAVHFYHLLRSLPDDAKTIVDLMFTESGYVAPRYLRQLVRDRLRRVWTKVRVDQAFAAIVAVLRPEPADG